MVKKARAAKNKKLSFKKKLPLPLVIFVLLFAVVGVTALIRSFAATSNGKIVYENWLTSYGIFASEADGHDLSQLSSSSSFNMPIKRHPNGQYALYAGSDYNSVIIGKVSAIDGSQTTTFATTMQCTNAYSERLNSASFNPNVNGTQPRLVFAKTKYKWSAATTCSGSPLSSTTQLIATNGDGSNKVVLYSGSGDIDDVTWGTNGKVYFTWCPIGINASNCALKVHNTSGSIDNLVTNVQDYLLSGDSSKIVYNGFGPSSTSNVIKQMNSDGTGNRTLMTNEFSSGTDLGCVGYSGHAFVYRGYTSGAWYLFYANDSGTIKNKVIDKGFVAHCDFSPSNDKIAYSGSTNSILIVNSSDLSGKTKLITNSRADYFDW